MQDAPELPKPLANPPALPRWQRWLVVSPLARIVFFVAMLTAFTYAYGALLHIVGWNSKGAAPLARALVELGYRALPALLAYVLVVRLIERRRLTELAPGQLLPYLLAGLVGGALLFSAVFGLLWLLGSYQIIGSHPQADWLPALVAVGLGAGIGEEIICRGVLFRIVEEGLGTWWALAISALLFGAPHAFNPGATLWSSAAIAIEAGVMFGLLFHLTRSLWPCIGLHAAWNFTQGTVYGIPVSGTHADGWLVTTRHGPDWLSGGSFGAEASVIAVLTCSVVSVVLIVIARRRGSIVPFRRRH
ncbi:MAG: type II CAAX endopeptidase family protein [Dyella sp.]